MAPPVDSDRTITQITTAGTSHAINVGSPVAGTLLVVHVRFAQATGSVGFTGYNNIANDNTDASSGVTHIYWRAADGAEGATDTLTTGTSIKLAAVCYEITGAVSEAPQVSTVAIGTTVANTCESSSVAPASPPQDTLYLTLGALDGEGTGFSAAPTNYVNLTTANSGTGGAATSNCIIGSASREISASSSDDAGAFTHAAALNGWTAFAVAIRAPAAGFQPRHEAINFTGTAVLMGGIRRAWHRRSSGIFVPEYAI